MSSVVTNSIAQALGYGVGYLLHSGFEVKCVGTPGTDTNGLSIVTGRHLICTLADHLPGAQAHAIGNAEFTDDLWTIETNQAGIDWSNPTCRICGKGIAP